MKVIGVSAPIGGVSRPLFAMTSMGSVAGGVGATSTKEEFSISQRKFSKERFGELLPEMGYEL